MILNPRIHQLVRIRYGRRLRDQMPLHDQIGRVVVRSRGRPRNHLVQVAGELHVLPCGNLMPVTDRNSREGCEDVQEGPVSAVNGSTLGDALGQDHEGRGGAVRAVSQPLAVLRAVPEVACDED